MAQRKLTQILVLGIAAGLLIGALSCTSAQASKTPFRIVIDPGHGGSDQGAIFDDGKLRVAEKDATLLIARQVSLELKRRGYAVTLTRNRDEEIALPNRTALANRLGADVFLSIHMNSAPAARTKDAQGIETYILNNTSDASSKRLAHLENKILGGSQDQFADRSDQAFDPGEKLDLALILKDLRLDGNMAESKRLACSVQDLLLASGAGAPRLKNLKKRAPSSSLYRNRGVKQALFHVLLGADMPSALVEAGFLNSQHDRELILSSAGRRTIGIAIARAVERYQSQKGTPLALKALSSCKVN